MIYADDDYDDDKMPFIPPRVHEEHHEWYGVCPRCGMPLNKKEKKRKNLSRLLRFHQRLHIYPPITGGTMSKEKLFLIRPVRGISDEYREKLDKVIASLRRNFEVYDPLTETDQVDDTGYRICSDNLAALQAADIVGIAWDGKSQGCLFDLGMAFALGKRIYPIYGFFPDLEELPEGKYFAKMVHEWSRAHNAVQRGAL